MIAPRLTDHGDCSEPGTSQRRGTGVCANTRNLQALGNKPDSAGCSLFAVEQCPLPSPTSRPKLSSLGSCSSHVLETDHMGLWVGATHGKRRGRTGGGCSFMRGQTLYSSSLMEADCPRTSSQPGSDHAESAGPGGKRETKGKCDVRLTPPFFSKFLWHELDSFALNHTAKGIPKQ